MQQFFLLPRYLLRTEMSGIRQNLAPYVPECIAAVSNKFKLRGFVESTSRGNAELFAQEGGPYGYHRIPMSSTWALQ
jgi:hypothetical protein